MRIHRVSTKLFLCSAVVYVTSFVCYWAAKNEYNSKIIKQIEENRRIGILHIEPPDLAFWDYAVIMTVCVAVAIMIAGIWLRRSEA